MHALVAQIVTKLSSQQVLALERSGYRLELPIGVFFIVPFDLSQNTPSLIN